MTVLDLGGSVRGALMCVLQCVLQYVLMCVLMYVLQLTTGSNPVHCYCRGPVLQLHLHPSLASRLPPPPPPRWVVRPGPSPATATTPASIPHSSLGRPPPPLAGLYGLVLLLAWYPLLPGLTRLMAREVHQSWILDLGLGMGLVGAAAGALVRGGGHQHFWRCGTADAACLAAWVRAAGGWAAWLAGPGG